VDRQPAEPGLAQIWNRKEMIVVDDDSRDRMLAIPKQFESSTSGVFTQKNRPLTKHA